MSIECYPTDEIRISVDNPGYGYVEVHNFFDHERCSDYCWTTLAGPKIGETLRELQAAIAAARENGRTYLSAKPFGGLTTIAADKVLTSLVTAIVYAAAGSEFAERVLDLVEPEHRPQPPVCVRCGEGHLYSSERTVTSGWCTEHGHRPFGLGDHYTWARAVEKYESDLRWHETCKGIRTLAAVSP